MVSKQEVLNSNHISLLPLIKKVKNLTFWAIFIKGEFVPTR